jgi:hypothetical protein
MAATVSTNGQHGTVSDGAGATESFAGADVIAAIREQPRNVHLFRGFGPLVAGAVLFVLMLLLAPSVAPEHVVERPAPSVSTTTIAPTTTVAP